MYEKYNFDLLDWARIPQFNTLKMIRKSEYILNISKRQPMTIIMMIRWYNFPSDCRAYLNRVWKNESGSREASSMSLFFRLSLNSFCLLFSSRFNFCASSELWPSLLVLRCQENRFWILKPLLEWPLKNWMIWLEVSPLKNSSGSFHFNIVIQFVQVALFMHGIVTHIVIETYICTNQLSYKWFIACEKKEIWFMHIFST